MIARLSKRMASFFARNNVIKSEDEEVYEYGLQLLQAGTLAIMICYRKLKKCWIKTILLHFQLDQ